MSGNKKILITVKLSTPKKLIPEQTLPIVIIIMTNKSFFFKTLIFNGFLEDIYLNVSFAVISDAAFTF